MGPSKLDEDLATLATATADTANLIRAFQSPHLSNTHPNLGPHPHPNPVAVVSDASKILKAQTTKLGLLLLNKPFTPREIAHIFKSLNNSCLPALATTLDLCLGANYTKFLQRYINGCLSSIWIELLALVKSIPKDREAVEELGKDGTLLSTGVLWATCDKLVRVGADGLISVASDAVKDNQALLQDAIDELDEWDPDEDDDEDDEDDEDDAESKPTIVTPTTSDEESLVEEVQEINLNPIVAVKARVLKHLRLVRLLYPALNKHRIKTFTDIKECTTEADLPQLVDVKLFDEVVRATQSFTEEADEIAGALYSGDAEEVERRLKELMTRARGCVKLAQTGYDGKEDVFSEWAQKWIARSQELAT